MVNGEMAWPHDYETIICTLGGVLEGLGVIMACYTAPGP
jgi:hypothetical protein